jgi:hypothetical protein
MCYLIALIMLAGTAWAADNTYVPMGLCGICTTDSPCLKGYEQEGFDSFAVLYWCETNAYSNDVRHSPRWYMKRVPVSNSVYTTGAK